MNTCCICGVEIEPGAGRMIGDEPFCDDCAALFFDGDHDDEPEAPETPADVVPLLIPEAQP